MLNIYQLGKKKSKVEAEADYFACALLMPEKRFKELWEVSDSIDDMADIFIVPRQAIVYRLKMLGLIE